MFDCPGQLLTHCWSVHVATNIFLSQRHSIKRSCFQNFNFKELEISCFADVSVSAEKINPAKIPSLEGSIIVSRHCSCKFANQAVQKTVDSKTHLASPSFSEVFVFYRFYACCTLIVREGRGVCWAQLCTSTDRLVGMLCTNKRSDLLGTKFGVDFV